MCDHRWRDIETAPKDGTRILVMLDVYPARSWGRVTVAQFDRQWSTWHSQPGKFLLEPTRWMPLPDLLEEA